MFKSELLNQLESLRSMVLELPDHEPVESPVAFDIVTEQQVERLTGFSIDTLKSRRMDGSYPQNVVWWHDLKGRVVYDLAELERVMRCRQQKENTPVSRPEVIKSESGFRGKAKGSLKNTQRPTRLQV